MIKYIFLLLNLSLLQSIGYSQCYFGEATTIWKHGKTTGVPEVDALINQQDNQLMSFFELSIDLYVGGEDPNEANAFFYPACQHEGCTGEIWLGLNLMVDLFQKEYGSQRLQAVFAHEYAHALQHKHGWAGLGSLKELHADYLAGFFMGSKKNVTSAELSAFIDQFYSMGDNNFFSPYHHGTHLERGCAFKEGFYLATKNNYSIYQAYIYGLDYVGMKMPCNSFIPKKKYNEITYDPSLFKKTGSMIIKSDGIKTYRVCNLQDQLIAEVSKNNFVIEPTVPAAQYTFKIYELSLISGWMYKGTISIKVDENYLFSLNLDSRNTNGTTTLVGKNNSKQTLLGMSEYADLTYTGKGEFEKMLTYFQNAVNLNVADINARFMLAFSERMLNNYSKAIEHFDYVINHIDNLDYPFFNLANLYSNYSYCLAKMDKLDNANKFFNYSGDFKANDPTIDGCEAFIRFKEKNYDEALKLYNIAIDGMLKTYADIDFQNFIGLFYYERGKVYEAMGDLTKACMDFKEAQKRDYKGAGQYFREVCK